MRIANNAGMAFYLVLFSIKAITGFTPSISLSNNVASFGVLTPPKFHLASKSYQIRKATLELFSQLQEEKETIETAKGAESIDNGINPDAEGLPWWWDAVWKLEIMQPGEPGTDLTFGDTANVLRYNIEQIYGGYPSKDGCELAEGALDDIGDGTMFVGLERYWKKYGSPYKLCFGPK